MNRICADVFVSGGGIAGLVAAAAFSAAGFSVVLADPDEPPKDMGDESADLRSTAFLQPARSLLARLGLWPRLEAHATPLDVLRIVDTAGWPPEVRATRDFVAAELGELPFGWNLPNWMTRRELLAALRGDGGVELAFGTGFRSILTRTTGALVTLSDGRQVAARLAVAADGRASPLREAAGIGVSVTRYGQKSLAFVASHPVPHGNVSTEIYNVGGPFTMVPLPDIAGKPASAIVWMNPGPRAIEILGLPKEEFEAEMTMRSAGLFGPMALESRLSVWPIVTQRALRLVSERVAIVAEAAHVLPPIGAQGLNTSLQDIAALVDIAAAKPAALGEPGMLADYARARETDIRARAAAIDAFNRVTRSGDAAAQAARLLGLRLAHDVAPIRKALMRSGLGPTIRA